MHVLKISLHLNLLVRHPHLFWFIYFSLFIRLLRFSARRTFLCAAHGTRFTCDLERHHKCKALKLDAALFLCV